ncbi:DUF6895 family protein [Streptomyces sp. DT24]|uniref:DUF6895 family protein n=1 Tax=Streptomyces sp. DT24 TaxID=3416520 RepID=UPI003CF9742C
MTARLDEGAASAAVAGPGALLREVAGAALGWVHDNRSGFRLPDDVLEPHVDVNSTLKPLGELVQLCSTVRRRTLPGDPHHEIATALVRYAWEETREGDLLLDLLREEPFATYPFEIYAAFAGDGMRHAGFEGLASVVASTRSWALTEQHANRELGLLNCERRVGLPRHTDPGPALRRTWLGGLPEPWTFERASGYSLTHVVYHLTDWGNTPRLVPPDIAEYLSVWLPCWVDGCLENGQWDLAAELLAVGACLPEPPPAALVTAPWTMIAAVQDRTGAVPETGPVPTSARTASGPPPGAGPGRPQHGPGPAEGATNGDGRTEDGTTGDPFGAETSASGSRAPYPFLHCYHSTLVTAFAASLTLARLRPGPPPDGDRQPAGRRDGDTA